MPDAPDELLTEIEAFLRETGMTPTAFGRAAMNDPAYVFVLRGGRESRRRTQERARQAMRRFRNSPTQ